MRALKVKPEDLFPFSTEVDSGVSELVRKHLKNPMAPTC
jgi:intracellular sulfur oxidation DsrE/DsrF family protein